MSIFATFVSSISFLGLPGGSYVGNWNQLVFSLSIPLATWLAAKVFIPLYRSMESVSAYHYLELKFGYWARAYVALCYLLTQLARVGSILLLLAISLNTMFGWDVATVIIATGCLTLLYSLVGGIAAVMWCDALQGIILIVAAVVTGASTGYLTQILLGHMDKLKKAVLMDVNSFPNGWTFCYSYDWANDNDPTTGPAEIYIHSSTLSLAIFTSSSEQLLKIPIRYPFSRRASNMGMISGCRQSKHAAFDAHRRSMTRVSVFSLRDTRRKRQCCTSRNGWIMI